MILGFKQKSRWLVSVAWLLLVVLGCVDHEPTGTGEALITIGDSHISVEEFNRYLELAKSAYSQTALKDPAVLEEIRLGVLNRIIEERMLMKIAESFSLSVSNDEVEQEVERFKSDYPEDVFDQLLLESAVSYESWKKGLKIRLLGRKVAETVLGDRVVITSDDVSEYYKRHYSDVGSDRNEAMEGADINERIIARLRSEKTEKAYQGWIAALKRTVEIGVNPEQWKRIAGETARNPLEEGNGN